MTRIFSYLMTAILSVGFTLIGEGALRAPKTSADSATQLTNAAFRDGRYMAKLDIENGRAPHLGVGRWSNQQDRASYVAGYQLIPQFDRVPPGKQSVDRIAIQEF